MERVTQFVLTLCILMAFLAATGCSKPADTSKPGSSETSKTAEPAESTEAPEATPNATPSGEVVTYTIDPDYSSIMWNATVPIGTREGGWTMFDGTITMEEGKPETMKIDVTVDMTSAFSDAPELTEKLQGDENFFKPGTYPTSTFKSKSVKKTAEGYEVTGDFTIRGVTKEVTFPATVTIEGDKLTAQATLSMNRQDFGITYHSTIGDYVIQDMCKLILDIIANKTDKPAA